MVENKHDGCLCVFGVACWYWNIWTVKHPQGAYEWSIVMLSTCRIVCRYEGYSFCMIDTIMWILFIWCLSFTGSYLISKQSSLVNVLNLVPVTISSCKLYVFQFGYNMLNYHLSRHNITNGWHMYSMWRSNNKGTNNHIIRLKTGNVVIWSCL